jgi:hypothetical protein
LEEVREPENEIAYLAVRGIGVELKVRNCAFVVGCHCCPFSGWVGFVGVFGADGTRTEVDMLSLCSLPFGWVGFAGDLTRLLRSDSVRVERLSGAGVVGAAKADTRNAERSVNVFIMTIMTLRWQLLTVQQ